ncbi:hypothetical protein ACIQYL_12200 [Lysinibacillus xylanilyticus]|uniref:hypothetical protein n=1 Tax=Lysinibacillus xylanilyticus TaxID=582475 RepID=UPI0037F7F1F6
MKKMILVLGYIIFLTSFLYLYSAEDPTFEYCTMGYRSGFFSENVKYLLNEDKPPADVTDF